MTFYLHFVNHYSYWDYLNLPNSNVGFEKDKGEEVLSAAIMGCNVNATLVVSNLGVTLVGNCYYTTNFNPQFNYY